MYEFCLIEAIDLKDYLNRKEDNLMEPIGSIFKLISSLNSLSQSLKITLHEIIHERYVRLGQKIFSNLDAELKREEDKDDNEVEEQKDSEKVIIAIRTIQKIVSTILRWNKPTNIDYIEYLHLIQEINKIFKEFSSKKNDYKIIKDILCHMIYLIKQ